MCSVSMKTKSSPPFSSAFGHMGEGETMRVPKTKAPERSFSGKVWLMLEDFWETSNTQHATPNIQCSASEVAPRLGRERRRLVNESLLCLLLGQMEFAEADLRAGAILGAAVPHRAELVGSDFDQSGIRI